MRGFARFEGDVWRLDPSVEPGRRKWLLLAPPFERLAADMLREAKVEAIRWERSKEDSRGRRFVVVIRVDPARLDLFFNSSSGYRAQFLAGPQIGRRADRHVLDVAMRELAPQLASRYGPAHPQASVEASIAHPRAKVWIHQGQWLRFARRDDRVLKVAAWQARLESDDKNRRKKARWGMLAPHTESLLLLKGAYLHEGRALKVGKDPADRARDLHELGFT
jgi:hypothetical protein